MSCSRRRSRNLPDAVAVVFDDQQLSYRELNRQANQLAHYFRRLGVGPESLVGICMERSLEMVVGLLGILKAGGAYVPLDPSYPKERLGFMLQDAQIKVLLTQQRMIEYLGEQRARAVCLDSDCREIAQQSDENLNREVTANNLAYVMYTSGSTGRPKGVEVLHRGVLRLLFGVEYVRLDVNETFLHLAPTSFDASTFEIWGALLHGSRCVLFPGNIPSPNDLGNIIHRHEISTLWLTASLFNTVIDEAPEVLSGLRQLLIGGETLSVPHVRRALTLLPQTQIINGFGPTESTTFTCCYGIPAALEKSISSIPIGRPIANTQVYLLDTHLAPVPIGVAGELHIGGDGLARGYLNRPELTAERVRSEPVQCGPGRTTVSNRRPGSLSTRRQYRVSWTNRRPGQNPRFRIEPGEIESRAVATSRVREAVVLAREEMARPESGVKPTEKRLVAYVVPRSGDDPIRDLRNFLKAKLPDYMVPSAFVFLDKLPLTPNGKIDRRALPAPDGTRPEMEQTFVAPRTAAEKSLADIWADMLRLDRVGIHDNFFDLGGHSLLATQVISRMRDTFQVELPLRSLFESPTVGSLAAQIVESLAKQAPAEEMASVLAELESLSEEEARAACG